MARKGSSLSLTILTRSKEFPALWILRMVVFDFDSGDEVRGVPCL